MRVYLPFAKLILAATLTSGLATPARGSPPSPSAPYFIPSGPFDRPPSANYARDDPFGTPANPPIPPLVRAGADAVTAAANAVDAATANVKAGLARLQTDLAKRPPKVNAGSWKGVVDAANQLESTADSLMKSRAQVNSTVIQLLRDSGSARSSLGKVETQFSNLAAEAEQDLAATGADPLPEALRQLVAGEVAQYRRCAEATKLASQRFQSLVDEQREKAAVIDRSGKTLLRVKQAAVAYRELGAAGMQLVEAQATLATFGEQLNAVLGMLDSLGAGVDHAIRSMERNPSLQQARQK